MYTGTEFFEFPMFSELVDTAMHLYGPPVHSTNGAPFQIYPCMNFTCPGRITKLMFVASVMHGGSNQPMLWPEYSLWRNECGYNEDGCEYGWLKVKTLNIMEQLQMVMNNYESTIS